MSSQLYDLGPLEAQFKQLQADKKKADMKTLEYVLELNKNIKIDQILIRQGYQIYPDKAILQKGEKKKEFKEYHLFFQYIVENIDTIEENYLKQSNDKEQIEQAGKENSSQYNFLLNKNSISKFVRDQAHHYQNTIEKYLEDTGEDDEKGIKTKNMHSFFRELFANQCTKIIKDHSPFLQLPEEQIAIHVGNTLISYAQEVKDMTAEQAQGQFSINQEEVLDFLTFWLKRYSEQSLFVLYARTSQRLEKQSKILMNKSNLQVKIHPSRMTKDDIKLMEKQQEEAGEIVSEEAIAESRQLERQAGKEEQYKAEKKGEPSKKVSFPGNNSALSLFRSRHLTPVDEGVVPEPPKQLTKEEKLDKQMARLFKFGCKRRYKVTKNNTFDELSFELTNMNLQKFINFCNFFQIHELIARDLLIEYFKLFALNLRQLDYSRFEQIILKLVKTDGRVTDHLLEKGRYEVKSKRNDIKTHKRSEGKEGKLSGYKFKLRPVNGKDISTMEKELTFRKLEKQIDREEKDQQALVKREKLDKTKNNMRSISHFGESQIDVSRFETIKEPAFNPEKMISFDKDKDDLWDAYEAKIWKKQSKPTHNTLEEILSRRISKGTSIISKMNSERSLLYE